MSHNDAMPDTWKQFGPTLRAKREATGMNMSQAAHRAGMAPNTWSLVERTFRVVQGNEIDYPPTRDFVIKAARALNWDTSEALVTAGFPPERLPADSEPRGPIEMLKLWNQLSKQQQRALRWTMQLMLDKHAALVDEQVPPADRSRPVFTDSPEGSRSRA